jgi:hypothetical protein
MGSMMLTSSVVLIVQGKGASKSKSTPKPSKKKKNQVDDDESDSEKQKARKGKGKNKGKNQKTAQIQVQVPVPLLQGAESKDNEIDRKTEEDKASNMMNVIDAPPSSSSSFAPAPCFFTDDKAASTSISTSPSQAYAQLSSVSAYTSASPSSLAYGQTSSVSAYTPSASAYAPTYGQTYGQTGKRGSAALNGNGVSSDGTVLVITDTAEPAAKKQRTQAQADSASLSSSLASVKGILFAFLLYILSTVDLFLFYINIFVF